MPERIQLSRAKGWRMPPGTVKVSRPSAWGNPYRVEVFGRDLAIALFRNSVEGCWSPALVASLSDATARHAYDCHVATQRKRLMHNVPTLRGKNLACWCKPGEPCHADVLLELANVGTQGGGKEE
jgi:hypothetical protein